MAASTAHYSEFEMDRIIGLKIVKEKFVERMDFVPMVCGKDCIVKFANFLKEKFCCERTVSVGRCGSRTRNKKEYETCRTEFWKTF